MYDAELEKELQKEFKKFLNDNLDKITLIFLKAIAQAVYKSYDPHIYERRYQLYNLDYKIVNNELLLFISDNVFYNSAVNGRDVSQAVPYWVEVGHNDRNPKIDQYHHYNGRKYLELAKQLIKNELGIDVTIVLEQPPTV